MALRNEGPKALPALPQLTAALKDPDPNVRLMAGNAIAAIGPQAAPAVPALMSALLRQGRADPRPAGLRRGARRDRQAGGDARTAAPEGARQDAARPVGRGAGDPEHRVDFRHGRGEALTAARFGGCPPPRGAARRRREPPQPRRPSSLRAGAGARPRPLESQPAGEGFSLALDRFREREHSCLACQLHRFAVEVSTRHRDRSERGRTLRFPCDAVRRRRCLPPRRSHPRATFRLLSLSSRTLSCGRPAVIRPCPRSALSRELDEGSGRRAGPGKEPMKSRTVLTIRSGGPHSACRFPFSLFRTRRHRTHHPSRSKARSSTRPAAPSPTPT